MFADMPTTFDLEPVVTVEVECRMSGCVDGITVFHVCGETVYVGPGVPNYWLLPGAPCRAYLGRWDQARLPEGERGSHHAAPLIPLRGLPRPRGLTANLV